MLGYENTWTIFRIEKRSTYSSIDLLPYFQTYKPTYELPRLTNFWIFKCIHIKFIFASFYLNPSPRSFFKVRIGLVERALTTVKIDFSYRQTRRKFQLSARSLCAPLLASRKGGSAKSMCTWSRFSPLWEIFQIKHHCRSHNRTLLSGVTGYFLVISPAVSKFSFDRYFAIYVIHTQWKTVTFYGMKISSVFVWSRKNWRLIICFERGKERSTRVWQVHTVIILFFMKFSDFIFIYWYLKVVFPISMF